MGCGGSKAVPFVGANGGADQGAPAAGGNTSAAGGLGTNLGSGGQGNGASQSGGRVGSGATGTTLGSPVTFSYKPGWPGATSVVVVGAFGTANDWKLPLVTLTAEGAGVFSGTVNLPPGQYPYLFQVTGDADAKVPAAEKRLIIDPSVTTFAACPAASPSATNPKNPCSLLTVPRGTADPVFHVRGTVHRDGTPVPGWLVLVERDEAGSHHFIANRADTEANGAYDFVVSAGSYRLQVLPPDDLKQTDAMRQPATLLTVRRDLSSSFKVDADLTLDPAEVAFHDYDKMTPNAGTPQALPIALSFTLPMGLTSVRAAIYGEGNNIGDPWWDTPYGTQLTSIFDGKFTTMMATETMASSGKEYWWGVWADGPKGAAGVVWTQQSMVLPLAVR